MACSGPITLKGPHGLFQVSCGQCVPCRIRRQSSLALRCELENRGASSGWFLTLTYAREAENTDYSDMARFLDRLRIMNRRAGNSLSLRYIAIGEYGERLGRFHWHALVWNSIGFSQEIWLTRLWPAGFSQVGTIGSASIRYVTRYNLKHLSKDQDALPRGRSQRPMLGETWFRELGVNARTQGLDLPEPPTTLRLDGRSYPVDTAGRISFAEGYRPEWIVRNAAGTRRLAKSSVAPVMDRVNTLVSGDPLAKLRLVWESSAQHRVREASERGKF